MTTQATLQADINTWMARSDLTSPAATFIRKVEAEIARKVRVKAQETSVVISATSGVFNTTTDGPGGVDLRVLKVIALALSGDRGLPMEEVAPPVIRTVEFSGQTGRPRRFSQEGCSILFEPRPDATDPTEMVLVYFRRFDALVSSADTNWLLQNHYDVYLNGALKHAAKFVQDWESMQVYSDDFERAIAELKIDQNRARRANNFMGTDRRFTP